MKTLLFFDRCELTYLFGELSKRFPKDEINTIHVVYSDFEKGIIESKGFRGEIINFREEIGKLLKKEVLDYDFIDKIDKDIISATNGRFNINSAIQSDRGFSLLQYEEALLLSQVYYKFWSDIVVRYGVNYVMHEPTSLMLNFLCSVVCKMHQALYISQIMGRGEDDNYYYFNIADSNFHAIEIDDSYIKYIAGTDVDKRRGDAFLSKFRASYEIYLGESIKSNTSYLKLFSKGLKESFLKIFRMRKLSRMEDNIDYWIQNQQPISWRKLKNLRAYKRMGFDSVDQKDKYYYYSMHLEPEAVVLYLGDGIYKGQIKLIENIAASLPAGHYLYVKDHPHEIGYRSVEDYLKLKSIPNVKLLDPRTPGKRVIKDCVGVFTINGTAGFEGLLLNKQVYTFGKTFYGVIEDRVNCIYNIRELRETIYNNVGVEYADDEKLYSFVNAYLDSMYRGMVDFFMNRADSYGIDMDDNYNQIASDFLKFSKKY